MMRRILIMLLSGMFFFVSAVITLAAPVAEYRALFEAGFTDGLIFGQLEMTIGDFGHDNVELLGWSEFSGVNGFSISFAGSESQSIEGYLYSDDELPNFQFIMRFNGSSGNLLSVGVYDCTSNSPAPQWYALEGSLNSFFTVGKFQAVPEPASVMLIGAGVLGLVSLRKKKR